MADKLLAVSASATLYHQRLLSNNYGQFDNGYFHFRGLEIRIKPFLCVLKFSFKLF